LSEGSSGVPSVPSAALLLLLGVTMFRQRIIVTGFSGLAVGVRGLGCRRGRIPSVAKFLLFLPFPMGGINSLSRDFEHAEFSRLSARKVMKLDLDSLRKAVVKDLLESLVVPFHELRQLIETDQILLDVLVGTHPQRDDLVLGILSGIESSKVELELRHESIIVVEPDGSIIGVRIDHRGFKPTESISCEVRDHVVDFLGITKERRWAVIEVEDALKKKGAEFLGVLSIKSLGIPNSGPSFIARGALSLLMLVKHSSKATANSRRHGPEEISRIIPVEVFPMRRRWFGISVTSTSTSIPTSAISTSSVTAIVVVRIFRLVPWNVPRTPVLIPERTRMMPWAIFPRTPVRSGRWRPVKN
jgi:hypothetical protein